MLRVPRFTRRKNNLILTAIIAALLVVGGWFFFRPTQEHQSAVSTTGKDQQNEQQREIASSGQGASISVPPKPKEMGIFNGADFKAVFDTYDFQNLAPLDTAPEITGNTEADNHIRTLAEARGYTRHRLATQWVDIQGFSLQSPAAEGWTKLQSAAEQDGIYLQLVAGFRTYDIAQAMFVAALANRDVATDQITSGAYDSDINAVLTNNAPPGYSRHQNGYVVDIGCGNTPDQLFGSTPCYQWLADNNYWHTKDNGWIPSYPPDGPAQGPNPEPWEYIWVGRDTLLR